MKGYDVQCLEAALAEAEKDMDACFAMAAATAEQGSGTVAMGWCDIAEVHRERRDRLLDIIHQMETAPKEGN